MVVAHSSSTQLQRQRKRHPAEIRSDEQCIHHHANRLFDILLLLLLYTRATYFIKKVLARYEPAQTHIYILCPRVRVGTIFEPPGARLLVLPWLSLFETTPYTHPHDGDVGLLSTATKGFRRVTHAALVLLQLRMLEKSGKGTQPK